MSQKRFVLLEIEAPDPPPEGGTGMLPMEEWVWQDFFAKHVQIKGVRILAPQHCSDCDDIRDRMSDYLCKHCRRNADEGYPTYEEYLADKKA